MSCASTRGVAPKMSRVSNRCCTESVHLVYTLTVQLENGGNQILIHGPRILSTFKATWSKSDRLADYLFEYF